MKRNAMTQEQIASLCLELSLMLHAGVGVGDGLALLAQEAEDPAERCVLSAMAGQVDGGAPLSAALRDADGVPSYVWGLVEVGERAGRTEEALASLARYYEERTQQDRRLRSALLYPAVMLVLMLAVIGVLLVKVLPIFDEVYATLGSRLTGVAGGLLVLGRWLDAAMPVLCALLALAAAFLAVFAASAPFRTRVLALWRRRRGDRGVSRQMNNARVAQAMAMGLRSGLPAEESLALAAGLLDDAPAARARCLDCRAQLEQGAALGEAMRSAGLLTAGQCRLLELGGRSGAGDAAMERIAAGLSEDSQAALEEKVSRVEPALVLVCSVLVGLILLSVMLPLMHIMTAIG